jgi:signal transduction histidine kinase
VSIADVARIVMSVMEPLAAKKAIRLETDLETAGDVQADAGKLRQMLINLVSNAIKFTPNGGRVTIGALRLAESVEISVSDTGIGIAQPELEHLFEEFRQVDSDITREQRGTGLGLALTRRYVELHGGQIRLATEVGKGSVFTLSLPLAWPGTEASGLMPALGDASMLISNR